MSFQSAQKRATIYSKVTDASPAHSASVRGSRSGKARLSFGTTSQERSGRPGQSVWRSFDAAEALIPMGGDLPEATRGVVEV